MKSNRSWIAVGAFTLAIVIGATAPLWGVLLEPKDPLCELAPQRDLPQVRWAKETNA